ncbi:MAG: class II glutamine amidotransferase [Polyangiaceae bacterium]
MCELFAMSARFPATVRLSFTELARHGGATGPHGDGWGVAFQEDTDVRLLREPTPASSSACATLLQHHEIQSDSVIAHIRLATQGGRALKNTQPFVRQLGGRMHTFAHNGRLDGIEQAMPLTGQRFRTVGDTDSEHAFCLLLEGLASLWQGGEVPPLAQRYDLVCAFAARVAELGPANFLYSDGDALFVHAHQRKQESGSFAPPGLHLLFRVCERDELPLSTDAVQVIRSQPEQEVALVASVPLSPEAWLPLREGSVLAFRGGKLAAGALAAHPG